jgi:hypothetical protein
MLLPECLVQFHYYHPQQWDSASQTVSGIDNIDTWALWL